MISLSICLGVHTQSQIQNWRQSEGVYELYGNTLEKFLEIHPITLILMYDDSEASQQALSFLPDLEKRFNENQIGSVVSKMRKRDGPRWAYAWEVRKVPYFRLCLGSGVSTTTRAYPNLENVFEWVKEVFFNHERIIEVRSKKTKEEFQREKNAFYLRFDASKIDYLDMLIKFQMLSKSIKVYYATNPAYDVFDNYKNEDVVIGFRRSFEDPIKFLSSPNKLNEENIQRFFQSFYEPTSQELTSDLWDNIVTKKIRTALYFGSNEHSKVRESFQFVAFEEKTSFLFVTCPTSGLLVDKLMWDLKVSEKIQDEIRIIEYDGVSINVFKIEGETTAAISEQFAKFNDNQLKPIGSVRTQFYVPPVETPLDEDL